MPNVSAFTGSAGLASDAQELQALRPLALLTRKRSALSVSAAPKEPTSATNATNALASTASASLPHAPPLSPVVVEPLRWSSASGSLAFLTSVERVEIREAVQRGGVTFYVLDVFLFHTDSRLPTLVNNPRRASASRVAPACCQRRSGEPDFRVERRYSDFERLRAQVRCWACMDAVVMCDFCDNIVKYTRFEPRQPRFLVKIATGVEQRKRILASFINDFVLLAQFSQHRNVRCEAREHVPTLIESFIRD